jgi:hypothetical protein
MLTKLPLDDNGEAIFIRLERDGRVEYGIQTLGVVEISEETKIKLLKLLKNDFKTYINKGLI